MKTHILSLVCALVSAVSAQAANIYFISFHPADNTPSAAAVAAMFTSAPDAGYTQLLAANGHTVTRVVSTDIPNATLLNAADLVIISRSVPSGNYELDPETAAWNGLTAPVMILGGYVLRNNRLGFTTGTTIPDVSTNSVRLRAAHPGHPIFNGVALDAAGTMVNPYARAVFHTNFLQRGISVNSNPLAGNGTVLAVVGSPGDAAFNGMVIAEWHAGATMATSPADTLGGRRLVFLTGSRENNGLTAEGSGIYDLEPDGAQLFLNAVNYMTQPRSSIIAVNTIDNDFPGPNDTSLLEALTGLQNGDYVRFNIPGAGPHVVVTPIGGYPLITAHNVIIDGNSQAGTVVNSNPILGGNNAQLRIVLDSAGTETAPNPNPTLGYPLRRSTRLDFPTFVGNTGYGDSENCILGVFEGDNVTIRGLSFIARYTASDTNDPSIYCVALVKQATNAHINGCLFGMAPGGTGMGDLKPAASSVAAFRWRIGGDVYSDGATIGTDGDGVNDRAEFNVSLGSRIGLALELPGARVSGNYVNVFPNGNTFVDIDALYAEQLVVAGEGTLEFMENGRFAHNTIIGTDGNGVSDSDERNIVGHTVYDVNIEFYSAGTNVVVAGNYFGVGVNGTTAGPVSTNINNDFLALPGTASARIGSNGDGISDALEGNLIVNTKGSQFVPVNANIPVVTRGNKFVNNNYAGLINDVSLVPPVVNSITNNRVTGTITGPSGNYTAAFIDLYTVDPLALANNNYFPAPITHPSRWLGAFVDNGPGDLDPAVDAFDFDVSAFGLTDTTYMIVTVTYSTEAAASNAGRAVTGPPSAPVSRRPQLTIRRGTSPTTLEEVVFLSWLGPDRAFVVQQNEGLDPNGWLELFDHTYTAGRSITEARYDSFPFAKYFYRLTSQ